LLQKEENRKNKEGRAGLNNNYEGSGMWLRTQIPNLRRREGVQLLRVVVIKGEWLVIVRTITTGMGGGYKRGGNSYFKWVT